MSVTSSPPNSRRALLSLVLVLLATLALLLWGIAGDLPYAPDVDEPIFVEASIGMVADRTLNPRWFGHPGSTVIYPTAALSAIWYEAAKELPPFAHAMPGIESELEANPTPFYMIGRLIVAAYVLGTVIATWLLGRRMLGDLGGGLAATFLPASAIVIQYGQLVRTDTAAMFFAVLALWLTVRALDLKRGRDWAIAAIAIGLAISSRYFFVTLAVPYLVAAVLAVRSARHEDDLHGSSARSLLAPFVALLAAPVTFAITSPYVILDARRALSDLRTENRAVHPGADGLSPIGNFLWYTTTVAPSIIGLAVLAVAAVGLVVVARRHPRATATLISFVGSYLVGVSVSPLHWSRYIIPLIPIIGIFAAGGCLAIGNALAERFAHRVRPMRYPWLKSAAVLLIVAFLLAPSIPGVVANARVRSGPSTRVLATDWVAQNIPPGDRIAQELYTTYLPPTPGRVLQLFSIAARPLDQYRAEGYRYLISSGSMASRYDDPTRYPREHAFYEELATRGRQIASFEPTQDRGGTVIKVFDLGADGG